jgi:hypothetical protein
VIAPARRFNDKFDALTSRRDILGDCAGDGMDLGNQRRPSYNNLQLRIQSSGLLSDRRELIMKLLDIRIGRVTVP